MERKHVPHYTKAIKGREVTGVFSVFGNLDAYNDVMWAGSFSKTMMERSGKIFHLWQHNMDSPSIAVIKSLREIGRTELPADVLRDYPEATGGAEVTREYLETPRADEIIEGLSKGVPYQMSFAFDALKYDFQALDGAKYEWEQQRNVREVRLWETSDVLWGANEATVASKSDPMLLMRQIHGLMIQLEAARKAGARHSTRDSELINQIVAAGIELGATNAVLKELETESEDDAAKHRAAFEALKRRARRIDADVYLSLRSAQ